jgi:hypothetical protein
MKPAMNSVSSNRQTSERIRGAREASGAPKVDIRRSAFVLPVAIFIFLAAAISPFAQASRAPASGATITFRKVFKSSYPEFVEIKVDESGKGTCDIRQLSDDASPQPFQIGAPIAQKIFDLAGKLHDFQGVDLEVHRRLANLGDKTFRYDNGSETHEVTFNYTMNPTATDLLILFENISRQESDLADLQRTMHYDHLGVNDVVQQIQTDYEGKLLPEPERFLPLLDQLAADEKYINIARDKARALAGRIRFSQ